MQNNNCTLSMNSISEDKCTISSFNSIAGTSRSKPLDAEIKWTDSKLKKKSKCDKYSHSEILCTHMEQDDLCNNKENSFFKVLNEDNGLNSEIERCVKLLSPRNSNSTIDNHISPSVSEIKLENKQLEEQTFSMSFEDLCSKVLILEEEYKSMLKDIELVTSQSKKSDSVSVDEDKGDKIQTINQIFGKEEKVLSIATEDNGLTAEIERCVKLLKPENIRTKTDICVKAHITSQGHSSKKLKLETEYEENKTKSNDIELLAFEIKELNSVNEEVLNVKEDITICNKEIPECSKKENFFKIVKDDGGLNAEIERCVKLLTPENTKIKISSDVNNHVEKNSRKKLKLENRELKEKTILITNQIKSSNKESEEQCKANLIDSELVTSKTKKLNSGVKENKKVANKVDVFEFNEDKFIRKTNEDSMSNLKIGPGNIDLKIGNFINDDKSNEKLIMKDYYEDEKEDIKDPGWEKIKELSTNEERYQQVKVCWGSTSVPNPNKNLTYHSYRKRLFNRSGVQSHQIKQHKRQASSNLSGNQTKRARPCTYLFDEKITSIKAIKEKKNVQIMKEMEKKMHMLDELHCQKITHMRSKSHDNYELNNIRMKYERDVEDIRNEYHKKAWQCDNQFRTEINSQKLIREEVLQFYTFFKGMHINEQNDPTILNDTQLQELEEIEKIYKQMDRHYI